jgi:hypothetical protein
MGAANRDEKLFELSGRDLKVHCRTDGGKILALELELRGTQRTFHGDSVQPQPVHEVGVLHTVTLNDSPGTPWVGFSLLLPNLEENLGTSAGRLPLDTIAIRTTGQEIPVPDPDPDPTQEDPVVFPSGIRESYELFELTGTVRVPGAPDLPEAPLDQHWSAVWTMETQGPDELVVEGILVFPWADFAVDLQPVGSPQASKNIRLQLTIRPPEAPTAEVPTTVVTRFKMRPVRDHETVTILPEGPKIPVETTVVCGERSAQQDGRQLKVEARLSVPPRGLEVGLRRAVPQGKDPKDLWLQLVVRKPTPPAANQRQIVVRYDETSDIAYKTVTIFPNRAAIPVNPSPADTGNG